jgi:hypothetical protein
MEVPLSVTLPLPLVQIASAYVSNPLYPAQLGQTFIYVEIDSLNGGYAPLNNSIIEINPINNLYYNLGLVGTLRLTNHVLLRANPTLLIIGTKNVIDFKVKSTPNLSQKLNVSSSIIHLPLALKFQSDRYNGFRYTNLMRHYFLVGGKFDFDLASNKAGRITPPSTGSSPLPVTYPSVLKGMDMGAEVGVGLSFYLRYATISPEVKFSYGLKNLNQLNASYPLMNTLDKVSSNFVYFTIHIEN